MITSNEISERIDKIIGTHFKNDFSFRIGQKEAILEICETFFNKSASTIILDAPTGSGKSMIAIISSLVLSSYSKGGYLIASDLSLQEQYEKDINQLSLDWGSVKGVDNYNCEVNGEKMSLGECKIRNLAINQISTLPCFSTCSYYCNRSKAVNSDVSLLNYSYWLIQRNYVEKKLNEEGQKPPFKKRDFIFFDEAHKIDEIIQGHFAPSINNDFVQLYMELQNFLKKEGYINISVVQKNIENEVYTIFNSVEKEELFLALNEIRDYLIQLISVSKKIKEKLKKTYSIEKNIKIPNKYKRASYLINYIEDIHCKIDDFIEIIKLAGVNNLVKIPNGSLTTSFQCLDETHLLHWYFHEKAPFKIMMSATFGNHYNYAKIAAIKSAKVITLKNDFDYSKSPIFYNKLHKLNYADRDKNLPHLITMLDRILEKHSNDKGIIHTGSYYFSEEILKKSKCKRIINYKNSKEKKEALQEFHESKNSIICGPSLLEGLDLYGDASRFQIFFKIPFPSLTDPMVKEKLKISNDWYNWKTVLNITQGVGRSVRNKNDWAITYFLDACFYDLLKKDLFPEEFTKRIIQNNNTKT